ncbi:MAG: succinate dehydrogenase assembly factor 2 [Pelagibacteraceae bacterium]
MSKTDFIKKLLFRSTHRGTKEMDLVLGGFFKNNYSSLTKSDLEEFDKLLEVSDKILTDYFVMKQPNLKLDSIGIIKKIKNYLEER